MAGEGELPYPLEEVAGEGGLGQDHHLGGVGAEGLRAGPKPGQALPKPALLGAELEDGVAHLSHHASRKR